MKNKVSRRKFLEHTVKYSAAIAVSGTLPVASLAWEEYKYSVVIKNGMIYDGTLKTPYIADIGIINDKIATIGRISGPAAKTIDASGKIITPGFIDVHTHCDLTFKRTGYKRYFAYVMPSFKGNYNYQYQGVATVVTGNCGYGYTDSQYWFDLADSVNFGSNICHLAPHGMIRKELFGDDQPAELNRSQLEMMKARVAEEMEKGAAGFSTGLEYAPGLLATTGELVEINKIVRNYGGVHATHVRDLTGRVTEKGNKGIIEALNEAVAIGREAEVPVQISHLLLKAPLNGVGSDQILEIIDKARLEGMNIHADQFPYPAGATLLSSRLPVQFKSDSGVRETYKTKAGREQIKKAIESRFAFSGPEKILIAMYPENTRYEGRTLKEIADATGKAPSDLYVDFVCEDQAPMSVFFDQDETIMQDIMKRDYIITASDSYTVPRNMSKPHPQAYGTFPKKIRKYVMDEKLIELRQVIRSMTSLPAEKFNIKKRGKIKTGHFADIAVLNLQHLTDNATFKAPHQYCEGIEHLFVNGAQSIENGKATGIRNGRILKRA